MASGSSRVTLICLNRNSSEEILALRQRAGREAAWKVGTCNTEPVISGAKETGELRNESGDERLTLDYRISRPASDLYERLGAASYL